MPDLKTTDRVAKVLIEGIMNRKVVRIRYEKADKDDEATREIIARDRWPARRKKDIIEAVSVEAFAEEERQSGRSEPLSLILSNHAASEYLVEHGYYSMLLGGFDPEHV